VANFCTSFVPQIVFRHSVRSDFTGFASAALTISLLITVSAIIITKRTGIKNIHHVNGIQLLPVKPITFLAETHYNHVD